ncbi:uncharacterized protein TNCV_3007881 [Trichonephila clavipes]|nr:uncharacterized protein TNCV_3007881 [Trichonephila clavipes]
MKSTNVVALFLSTTCPNSAEKSNGVESVQNGACYVDNLWRIKRLMVRGKTPNRCTERNTDEAIKSKMKLLQTADRPRQQPGQASGGILPKGHVRWLGGSGQQPRLSPGSRELPIEMTQLSAWFFDIPNLPKKNPPMSCSIQVATQL